MILAYAAISKLISSEGNLLLWWLAWIELAVAIPLILTPQSMIPVALSLYSGFVGFLLVLWGLGERTCNCFGVGSSDIFLALTIDPVVITLLLFAADGWLRQRAYLLCGGMAAVGAVLAPTLAEYTLITSYSGGLHVRGAVAGELISSSELSHRISVTNRSLRVLEVGSVFPTCNCTTVGVQPFRMHTFNVAVFTTLGWSTRKDTAFQPRSHWAILAECIGCSRWKYVFFGRDAGGAVVLFGGTALPTPDAT